MVENLIDEFEEDFGFSTIDINEVQKMEEIETKFKDLEDRLERVKSMVLPLLHNLQRDPDKDIHWPDRDVKLKQFEERFLNAINGLPDAVEAPKKRKKKVG